MTQLKLYRLFMDIYELRSSGQGRITNRNTNNGFHIDDDSWKQIVQWHSEEPYGARVGHKGRPLKRAVQRYRRDKKNDLLRT